jgi:hypothetical protein
MKTLIIGFILSCIVSITPNYTFAIPPMSGNDDPATTRLNDELDMDTMGITEEQMENLSAEDQEKVKKNRDGATMRYIQKFTPGRSPNSTPGSSSGTEPSSEVFVGTLK